MKIPLFDMKREIAEIRDPLLKSFESFLGDANFILGEQVKAFEDWLQNLYPGSNAIGVSSGTAALQLALQSIKPQNGGNIISPANTGSYAAVAARELNIQVKPVEICNLCGEVDISDLESLIDKETFAVAVAHLFGNVQDLSKLRVLCDQYGLLLIEDIAQGFGGEVNGKLAGSFGHICTLSFYPTKNLGSLGDAGAVITYDKEIGTKIKRARQYGWGEKYRILEKFGGNYRLDEIQAAFLVAKKSRIETDIKKRIEILRALKSSIPKPISYSFLTNHFAGSTAHLNVIRMKTPFIRSEAIKILNSSGIQTAVHYPYLDIDQVGLSNIVHRSLPQSQIWRDSILTIPLFSTMNTDEVEFITTVLQNLDKYLSELLLA